MRKIDADALTKLFRYVIGDIAKNPNMSKEEEHIVRASAMTIEMIADAPTIDEDTLCEVNLAPNAALICDILNEDKEGRIWNPPTNYYADCQYAENAYLIRDVLRADAGGRLHPFSLAGDAVKSRLIQPDTV